MSEVIATCLKCSADMGKDEEQCPSCGAYQAKVKASLAKLKEAGDAQLKPKEMKDGEHGDSSQETAESNSFNETNDNSKALKHWGLGIGAFIIVSLIIQAFDLEKSIDDSDALVYCHTAIKERLHNPSSFDYSLSDQKYSLKSLGNRRYDGFANGSFYATNGFGAMVKSTYFCNVLIDNSNDTYTIKSLDII